eukprot:m51a1_g8011 hypothetical protein (137) ;mRNA; r:176120-176793
MQVKTQHLLVVALVGAALTGFGLLLGLSGLAASTAALGYVELGALVGACVLGLVAFRPVREYSGVALAAAVLALAGALWSFFYFVVLAKASAHSGPNAAAATGFFFVFGGQGCLFASSILLYTGIGGNSETGYTSV